MDPTACTARLTDAIRDGDIDEAFNAALDLQDWSERGGFPPDDSALGSLLDALDTMTSGLGRWDALRTMIDRAILPWG